MNYYEFKFREADYGAYPKGLMYYLTMMDSWLYDENEPFIHVQALDTFAQLRKELDEGLFEELIQKYLLDNSHGSLIALVPSADWKKKKRQRKQSGLKRIKTVFQKEELEAIMAGTAALKAYQDEPSPQEELERIPMLKLSDIEREPAKLYIDKKSIADVDVIHHNLFTNQIAYLMLAFDCKKVPDELLPYVGLLSSVLGLMDTAISIPTRN